MAKRLKLRHNEYYNFQDILDELYTLSQQGKYFNNLIQTMKDEKNILLAYRNIKRNGGRNTPGVDGLTMQDIAKLHPDEVVARVQDMFRFYVPKPVRRKMIDKGNGKQRPLGIPCIWDRLFQQCILQVLEPICEAKFHNHSYGFRPNRGTHHALARMKSLINLGGLHHCVDVDIKGFFDNVHHGKLLKQMWTIGIRDKKLLSIISALIKAEITGEGVPLKGTPQGGILSPLLSNIVLNELDWWVSNQWETFETEHKYADLAKYRAMKKTGLKEAFIVRYADDFKILCRTRNQAIRVRIAVEKFLKERLNLECSEEKSKVINLKKQWSEFLGFQLKAQRKGFDEVKLSKRESRGYDKNTGKQIRKTVITGIKKIPKFVCISRMSHKAKTNARLKISDAVSRLQKSTTVKQVQRFNTTVMGIQNYYRAASLISLDLAEINFTCRMRIFNRLKNNMVPATMKDLTDSQKERYKDYDCKLHALGGVALVPIHAQRNVPPMNFNQKVCGFTADGRDLIHNKLVSSAAHVLALGLTNIPDKSIEYHDNRISKFLAQYGKCYVTGRELGLHGWHCHHVVPFHISKDDRFSNLVIVDGDIHSLIHMTDQTKINALLKILDLDSKNLVSLNRLRRKAGREAIKAALPVAG
ncbi:group II intron reverse transcriptase/maturase [Paenibacillus polymyxa]|uniref:group II intron reverse transcriptase/maturase n=1 Tax=Paenibacillus polymyxa TaxID=1406 RepID=UPI003217F36C